MTYGLKMSMNGLDLGTVQLVDVTQFVDKGSSPLANPLSYVLHGETAVLRYRNPSYQPEPALNGYELSLGMIIAAAAIVYTSPLSELPPSLAMVLLIRDPSRADDADEGLRVIIIEPGRTGEADVAHVAEPEKIMAIKKAMREEFEMDVSVLPEHVPSDLTKLAEHLIADRVLLDLELPVDISANEPINLNLLDSFHGEGDGRFYFRDILSGEADFFFTGQDDYDDLELLVETENGYLTLLSADEQLVNPRSEAEAPQVQSMSSDDVGDIEHFLARLVLNLDGNKEIDVLLSVYTHETLLLEHSINIVRAEDDTALDARATYVDGDDIIARESEVGLVEEISLEDVDRNLPDIL